MTSGHETLSFTITFPLADGRSLVQGPLTYNSDGLATKHNCDFINDPLFAEAYRLGVETEHPYGPGLHVEWRVYAACWVASNALRVPGDFVECGVASGIISRAIMHYINWREQKDRTFWLLDTFEGFPVEQLTGAEVAAGLGRLETYYKSTWESVQDIFGSRANVRLVKGTIPETLGEITSSTIAYLHLDCNAAAPERAAIEKLWPLLSPGGWVLFDDYGWTECKSQKQAMDAFAADRGLHIFSMPTGQGILIKP